MSKYLKLGDMPWEPNFSLTVEGADITDEVRENLVNLTLTDYGAGEKKSDQITFAVVSDTLNIPKKGVKISIGLGFGQELIDKGTYVVDSTSSGGGSSARIVEITARAFSKSNERGYSTLQSQKTRTWSNITLGDVVNTVASEHGLTPRVPESISTLLIDHVDQIGESDMNLLTRLGERYGAVSKVSHDYWIFTPRTATTNVGGQPLPMVKIRRDMVSSWNYQNNSDHPDSSSSGSGTQVISYQDVADGGKVKNIVIGSGQPVSHYGNAIALPNLKAAQEVAKGFSTTSKKKLKGMSITLPASPELMSLTSQCLVTTEGFGEVEDQQWHIAKLDIELGGQGLIVKMELE